MHNFIHWQGSDLLLTANIQPKSKKDEIIITTSGDLKIKITASPIDNLANKYLIKYLAKQFGVTQAQVTLTRGLHSKKKLLRINNPKKIPPLLQGYYEHRK